MVCSCVYGCLSVVLVVVWFPFAVVVCGLLCCCLLFVLAVLMFDLPPRFAFAVVCNYVCRCVLQFAIVFAVAFYVLQLIVSCIAVVSVAAQCICKV